MQQILTDGAAPRQVRVQAAVPSCAQHLYPYRKLPSIPSIPYCKLVAIYRCMFGLLGTNTDACTVDAMLPYGVLGMHGTYGRARYARYARYIHIPGYHGVYGMHGVHGTHGTCGMHGTFIYTGQPPVFSPLPCFCLAAGAFLLSFFGFWRLYIVLGGFLVVQ